MKYLEKNFSFSEGFEARGELKELVDKMDSLAAEREECLKSLEKTRLNMKMFGQGMMTNPGVNVAWKIPFLEDQLVKLEKIVRNCLINDELKNKFVVEYAKGQINSGLSSAAVVMLGSDAIKRFDEMHTALQIMSDKIIALEQRSPGTCSGDNGFESCSSVSSKDDHSAITAVSPSASSRSRPGPGGATHTIQNEDSVDGYFSPAPLQKPRSPLSYFTPTGVAKGEETHDVYDRSHRDCPSPANQLKEAVRGSTEIERQRRDSLVNEFKHAVKTRAQSESSANDDATAGTVLGSELCDDLFQVPPRMVRPKMTVPIVPTSPVEPVKVQLPIAAPQHVESDEDPEEQEVEPLIASLFAEPLENDERLSEVLELLEPVADTLNWKPFVKVLILKSIENSCRAEKGAQIYEQLATKAVIYDKIRHEVLSRCQKLFMARVHNISEWIDERLITTTGLVWLMARLYTASTTGKRMSILAVATLELLKTSVKLQSDNVKGCLRTVVKVLQHMKIELTKDTFQSIRDELAKLKAEVMAKEASLDVSMTEEKKLAASIIQLATAIM